MKCKQSVYRLCVKYINTHLFMQMCMYACILIKFIFYSLLLSLVETKFVDSCIVSSSGIPNAVCPQSWTCEE